MEIIPLLTKELKDEFAITRKFLEKLPADNLEWKNHEKSMSIKQLGVHLAEIAGWGGMALKTDGIDFAGGYQPTPANSVDEILDILNKSEADTFATLQTSKEEDLLPTWTMRMGDHVIATFTKYEVIRHAIAQMIHHRAQLGVCYRLLNMPVPATYGPSADDQGGF